MDEWACVECRRSVGDGNPYTYYYGKLLCMNCYNKRAETAQQKSDG